MRVRRLGGSRAGEIRLTRLLRHPAVQPERMLAEAAAGTVERCRGRPVLAVQDTTVLRSAGGGGTYLHVTLALDAEDGAILGLIDARTLTRGTGERGLRRARGIDEKESFRWLEAADAAASVCAGAAQRTVIADREGDIYEAFALRPDGTDLLVRAAHDRCLAGGAHLDGALSARVPAAWLDLDLPARPGRSGRTARLAIRFGVARLARPQSGRRGDLPAQVAVNVVDLRDEEPPPGEPALHWRLLTTRAVRDAADAAAVADLYRRRWAIEQLFRTLKTQGFAVEDLRVAAPEARERLVMATLVAAVIVQQLVHARDGAAGDRPLRPVTDAFAAQDQPLLQACCAEVEGKTARQKNPHPPGSLAYAAWICARLGGWTGYYGKPGPIVMLEGWKELQARKRGAALRLTKPDV